MVKIYIVFSRVTRCVPMTSFAERTRSIYMMLISTRSPNTMNLTEPDTPQGAPKEKCIDQANKKYNCM